ncbi:MAG: alpha/beta fold hydrolase [Balneolaceae bacterium]|nr:alpha/beta fold hydrolase [Balneolaceae bacterium]
MISTNSIPKWIDTNEYPFEHKFIELERGNMHYIDEGRGNTILFVHGTPTWSFLYRNFIKNLSPQYRTIAVDHIGFGLSDKPSEFSGHPRDHAGNLSEFIKKKDLKNITLVVHDFGGPIGVAAALTHPNRIKQVVLFNSWLWETESNSEAQKADKIINSFLGRFLYLRLNFSPRVLLKKGYSNKMNLSKRIHKQYINPFPNKRSRFALYRIAQALVGASDWYQRQWEQLSVLENKPWLILWGTEDDFFKTDSLKKWKQRLPDAHVRRFNCGHFVQEEKTKEAVSEIREFVRRR